MAFRDSKRRMRRDLHQALQVPAFYLLGESTPLAVTVRLHTRTAEIGPSGASNQGASRDEAAPTIRFLRQEVTPVRNAIVSVAEGEAYRIQKALPPDDEFQSALVTRLPAEETENFPVPEGA